MAEFVEFRTEQMVPELEELEKYRIFNEAEIRNIIKARKKFQYKIQRQTKNLEDYVRYIQYEMDLLMLVKTRRKKLGLLEKKHQVDMIVAHRVNKLFEQALFRFSDDINVWLSYMKFCKQIKIFKVNVSYKLIAMLAVHNTKPSLWKLAANWEFEENKSIENAIQFIMRGLRHHPSSKLLFEEAFRLELIYSDRKQKEMTLEDSKLHPAKQEVVSCSSSVDPDSPNSDSVKPNEDTNLLEQSQFSESKLLQWKDAIHDSVALPCAVENDISIDPVINCQNAKFIYENAIKRIPEASFLISLLNIAKHFDFTDKLQSSMISDLLMHFSDDELTWDTLAHLELEGVHFASDHFSNMEEDKRTENFVHQVAKTECEKLHYTRIRHCFTVYQNGLKHLNTERMWELYLDALIEMNQDFRILKKVKRKLLFSAFQSAHDADKLQEKHYIQWAGMNGVSTENLSEILNKATEKFPSGTELWQMRLRHHILQGQDESIIDIFRHATESLGSNESLPIWKMVIQYWETKSVDKVKELFEDGLKQGQSVSSALKQMYLEWLVSVKGIQAARTVYDAICYQPPFCFDVHKKMIELESLQPKVKTTRVTRCFDLACDQFGKSNIDVWMEYVKFEVTKGDAKKVKEIHQRALKTLDKELVQQFISVFCEYWTVHKFED